MDDRLTLSKFMYETIASGSTNLLPISSVCNARCFFCSNMMNPFPIYREGFRSLEDIKKGISLLDGNNTIRLGDSLPGRISEGEALLHPEVLTVLKLVRDKFPQTVIQINTNGILLTKDLIEKLAPYKPIKFTISYHSDNPRFWCKIFALREEYFKIARSSFFHLLKNGFGIEGALVALPALVGYDDLENTIKNLRMFTKEVVVYLPGYSSKVPPEKKKLLAIDFAEASRFMTNMRKKYKIQLSVFPDLLKPLPFYPGSVMQETVNGGFKNVLWLFSEAAYEKACRILEDFNPFVPNDHFGFIVKNRTYRGNIVCSGLLMVDDYRKAISKALAELKKRDITPDLLILPQNSFDRYGDDLKCENYAKLKEIFSLPVWLK